MERDEILYWLREDEPSCLEALWRRADKVRREHVGDAVHLRGLIEFSNYCRRQCHYCGLRAGNRSVQRYRLSQEQVFACARQAVELGYGSVVLQSGEDTAIRTEWVSQVVRRIRDFSSLGITLSLGEREPEELLAWREAGADRYLLRFETSNAELFRSIHPPRKPNKSSKTNQVDRLTLLGVLRELGYEVGSGVMIGLPGQSYDDLTKDILRFRELDLDMIGVGPYLSHPQTPLGQARGQNRLGGLPSEQQVPATEGMTYKVVALTRLVCPWANIPSTTALATLNPAMGRELALQRGANVVMPNVTPQEFRPNYEIYPNKACIGDTPSQCQSCLESRITGLKRFIGRGPGRSLNHQRRQVSSSVIPIRNTID